MVFGFFTRKSAPETPPESVQSQAESSTVTSSKLPEQSQLRTPSPSLDSVAHDAHLSTSPALTVPDSHTSGSAHPDIPLHPNATDTVTKSSLEPSPEVLTSLISTVPAKILHTYTLQEIPNASDEVLRSLATFFTTLSPPPKLHCVRCHKDYVEIENDDRSCLVPHDDDSAEVERVGRSRKDGKSLTEAPTYETLWGCCGRVTEGNGDQGPPDGWCYEGKHTTDIKRARFRADSTPQDDKLVSCLRLNCHGIRDQMPRSSARKRPRASVKYKEADTDEDESDGTRDSGMEEITGQKMKARRKSTGGKGKGKERAKSDNQDEDKMDVDEENGNDNHTTESASKAGSVRSRSTKPKPSTSTATVGGTPTTASGKRRGRPPKSKAEPQGEGQESASTAPKRRGRQPKSKATISDSEPEERGRSSKRPPKSVRTTTGNIELSPTRSHRATPPRTRSQSRSRVETIRRRVETVAIASASSSPRMQPKSRLSMSSSIVAESEAEDDGPRKRRKLAT